MRMSIGYLEPLVRACDVVHPTASNIVQLNVPTLFHGSVDDIL